MVEAWGRRRLEVVEMAVKYIKTKVTHLGLADPVVGLLGGPVPPLGVQLSPSHPALLCVVRRVLTQSLAVQTAGDLSRWPNTTTAQHRLTVCSGFLIYLLNSYRVTQITIIIITIIITIMIQSPIPTLPVT